MRILKERYEGLQEFVELPERLKKFIFKPEVQEALQKSDFGTLYKTLPYVLASEFTGLLNSLNINPLDYLDYVPIRFLANTSVKYIHIPDHISSISNYAFFGCSMLTRITIPNSVTSIGKSVFYDCTGLTSINYNGTKDQWSKINLNSEWDENSAIKTIHCTDGTLNINY